MSTTSSPRGTKDGRARWVAIEPPRADPTRRGELWDHRELLYFLIWRDIKVRYKQTALGAAWAILQPC